MKKVQIQFLVVFSFLSLPFQQAHAWGSKGHQALAEVGAKLAIKGTAFWNANISNMGTMANVPDNKWKSGSSSSKEKPLHYFEIDAYFSDPVEFELFPKLYSEAVQKYSAPTLLLNGLAPWRARQLFDLAVKAFQSGDYVKGVQMAGTMSHYIGDLSQPLHVTRNYDGKDTGNSGIHAFFETNNLNSMNTAALKAEIETRAKILLADPTFRARFQGEPLDEVFWEINRTYTYKDSVIQTDLHGGRQGDGAATQLETAKECLANGAATLALILSELWELSGNPNYAQRVKVKAPTWVAPQF